MNEDQEEPGFETVDRAQAPDFMSFSLEQTGSNQGTQGLQGIQATAPAYADNDAGQREYADASQDGVARQKDNDIEQQEQTLMRIRGVPAGHQSNRGFQSLEHPADFSSKRGFALSDNGQHDRGLLSRDSISRQQNIQNKSKLNQGAYHGNLQPRTFEFQEQAPDQELQPSFGQLQQEQRRSGQADDWQSSSALHGELQPHFSAVKYQSLHHMRQPQAKQHSSYHLADHQDGFQVAPGMSEAAEKEAVLRFRQQMMSKSPDGMKQMPQHRRGQQSLDLKNFQPSAPEFQYSTQPYHSPQKRSTGREELFDEQFKEYLAQGHARLATLPSQGKQTKGTGRQSEAKKKKRGFFAGLKEKVFRTNRKRKPNGQDSEALATGRSSSVDSPGPAERLYEEAAIEQLMHSRSPGSFKMAPIGAASEDPAYGSMHRKGNIRTRSGLVGVDGAGEFDVDLTAGMPHQPAQISITTPQTPQLGRKKPAAGRQMTEEFQTNSLHNQSHDYRRMEPQFGMDSPMAALKASSMSKSSINSKFSSTTPGQSKKLKQDFQKKLAELTNHNRKFVASQFQKTGAGDPCESLQRAVMLQNAKGYQSRAIAAGSPEGRGIEGNSPSAGFGAESQAAASPTPQGVQSMPMQSISLFGSSKSPSEAHEQRLNQPGRVYDNQNQPENGIGERTFGGAQQPQMAKQGALRSQASANEQGLRESSQQLPATPGHPASAEPQSRQQAMNEASVHEFPEVMSNYQYDAQSSALGDATRHSGAHQGQEFALPSQDHIDLHKYFKMNRYFVSDEDKIYLESYVIKGIPKQLRRKYWLTVSGAYGYLKHYGEGYYKTLSTDDDEGAYPNWPHPDYQVIQKDIQRTFSDEAFFKLQENQDKIRRVLRAFVRRNPVQGYIQSMNYIVGRLVMVLQEEEAFWVFTLIMEKYLPIDYMLDGLTGAMTDQKVFEHIVNYKYPMILEKLNELKVQGYEEMTSRSIFQTIVVSWFQSLFTYNTPCELSLAIMDLFLLNGNNTIFFIGLALVSSIKKQIMSCKSIEQLQGKILKSTKNPVFTRTKQILLKSQKYKVISPYEIFKFREYYQKETSNEISQAVNRAIIQEKNGTRKNTDTLKVRKQQFLKEFPNFAISRKGEKRIPLVMQSHSDPVKFFTCNQKWQICSFDFTFRKVISDTIAFRVKKFNVVQDYFYGINEPQESLRTRQKKTISRYEDLIVYRGHHICDSQTFMNYLPKLFTNSDEAECDKLLNMDVLKIKKLKHPERQLRFLERFKEQIRRLANRDYNQRMKNKNPRKDGLTGERPSKQPPTASKKPKREEEQQQQERISSGQANLKHSPTSANDLQSQAEKDAKDQKSESQIGLGQADKDESSKNTADVHEGPNQRVSRVSDLSNGLADGRKSGAQTSRTEKKPNQQLATKELPKLQHLAAYDFDLTKNGKMLMSFKPGVTNQNPSTPSQNSYFLGQSSDIRESLMSQRDASGSRAQVRRGTNNTRSFQNLKASFQSSRSNSNTRKDTGDFKMGDANMYVDVDFDDMYELEEVFYQIKFEMPRFREAHNEEEQKQEDQEQINSRSTPSSFEPFKIIMSKTDLDQMLLRGQSKSIFKLAEGNGPNEIALGAEQYEQQLQEVAAQNYLGIKLIDRETVGDEIYEALQLESLYARELGTKQMMKERDFDIILNLCKQRQEFQKCLVELQKQDAAALVGGVEGEEALSFENSAEENPSDDEDPGLMESALSGLSNLDLNAGADNKDPAQARTTFTHESQGALLPKDASSTVGHGNRQTQLTQSKSGSPSKRQLFKRYSITKTERNSIDELEKQFLIFESQVLADLQYAQLSSQLAQRKE